MGKLILDGKTYDVDVRNIKRKFQILDGSEATRALSGSMIRDIIGTYYNYTMEIETEKLGRAAYDSLYETLSAPVNSHHMVVPYGQTTLDADFYVTSGEDAVFREDSSGRTWSGLSIDFIAMEPARRP